MGAGKSAVGRELAAALEVQFVDTDEVIAGREGPIGEVFSGRGEAAFRRIETEVVTELIAVAVERPCVIALGGGAVLSEAVRASMRSLVHVVWLTAPAEELWARVIAAGGAAERPLAGDRDTFMRLLVRREPLYREVATLEVDTVGREPRAIAAALAAELCAGVAGSAHERARSGA